MQDRERNKIHARESRARKKQHTDDLEQRCRMLEARKQELLLQHHTFSRITPAASVEALQVRVKRVGGHCLGPW
jgi:hypothetical protein